MRPRSPTTLLTLLLTALLPAAALAGGYAPPDLGAIALSRGGAFAAKADNPTSIYYNPAGATQAPGLQILLDANIVMDSVYFRQRLYKGGTVTTAPEVKESSGFFPIPFIGATWRVWDKLNLAVLAGLYGPNSHKDHTFPRYCVKGTDPCEPAEPRFDSKGKLTNGADIVTAPQRYDMVSRSVLVAFPSVGVALSPFKPLGIKLLDGLSIGGVFQISWVDLKLNTVIAGGVGDVDAEAEVKSAIVATANLGLHWKISDNVELGVSARLPLDYAAKGVFCPSAAADATALSRDPSKPCSVQVGGNEIITQEGKAPGTGVDVTVNVPIETVVRSGVRYVHRDAEGREAFDVEFDFVWEQTSRLGELLVEFDRKTTALGTVLKPFGLPHNWKDTYGFRLGGQYNMYDVFPNADISFRGGAYMETAAAPAAYTRLDFLPFQRYGLSVGAGLRWRWLEVNVGYSHVFAESRSVDPEPGVGPCSDTVRERCGSDIRAASPLNPSGLGDAVGNGDYSTSTDQVMVGVRLHFLGAR